MLILIFKGKFNMKNYHYTIINEDNMFKIVKLDVWIQNDEYTQEWLIHKINSTSSKFTGGMVRAESFAQAEKFINEDFSFNFKNLKSFNFAFDREIHALWKIEEQFYFNKHKYHEYITIRQDEDDDDDNCPFIYGKVKAKDFNEAIAKINEFFCVDERGE